MRGIRFKVLAIGLLVITGCYLRDMYRPGARPATGVEPETYALRATGYCRCGSCCGWKRNWFGRPVVTAGALAGRPKRVGITASGTRAKPGTIAADTTLFPFGTVMHIPGYGYGRVEDRGSDIKGHHVDLYFRTHGGAMKWGNRTLSAKVWRPPRTGAR